MQAICIAACYNVEWPLLIVCPSSVTITWLEALYTWLSPGVLPEPKDIQVITSGKVCSGLRLTASSRIVPRIFCKLAAIIAMCAKHG